jgi:flagellar export protein FliJ
MSTVDLLIRLAQQTTDERRLDLGSIGRAHDEAEARLAVHDRTLLDESGVAETHVDGLAAFADWVPHAARARGTLQERSAELDRAEAAARNALREAFAATKRLELAREATLREARRSAARRAEFRADEQATIRQMADAD